MNRPDHEFDKNLELHASEWTEAGRPEPILGPGGEAFLYLGAFGFFAAYCFSTVQAYVASVVHGWAQVPVYALLLVPSYFIVTFIGRLVIVAVHTLLRKLPHQ